MRFRQPQPIFRSRPAFRSQRARRHQAGQTLTEYALIVAYVSLLVLQSVEYAGYIATEQLAYSSTALYLSQHSNEPAAQQKSDVANYLAQPSLWGNMPADKVASAQQSIESRLDYVIDNPGSS